MPTVGVLAVQGGFQPHIEALKRLPGISGVEVRNHDDLKKVDALILPGGESTSIGIGLKEYNLLEHVQEFCRAKPVWGICAGLILLANSVHVTVDGKNADASQPLVGGLDISVDRNYFGRQSASRYRKVNLTPNASLNGQALGDKAYFIRAPAIRSVGRGVVTLATVSSDQGNVTVAVREGNKLATCFHPEISSDDSWLKYFLTTVANFNLRSSDASDNDEYLDPTTSAPWSDLPRLGEGKLRQVDSVLTEGVKRAMMVYQCGGVIMDVVNQYQARIAEEAGAVSVMALERIPADIKRDGGVARSSDPKLIKEIMAAVSIPVMAKARIGHFAEAQMLEALDVDCIDESEVLTCADELHHIDKRHFKVPFVCGAKNLGEALRRIAEGASMIRLKGNAGTGNVLQAVRHARSVFSEIRQLNSLRDDELFVFAKQHQVPLHLVQQVARIGRLPVVTFAAGGLATPADVSLLMQLGCDGVFVGSGIFKGENPAERARAMVLTCSHYLEARTVATVSEGLGKGMVGVLDDGETYALGGGNIDSKL